MIRLVENDRKSDLVFSSSKGLPSQLTWKLDQALPGRHTLHLYGAFSSEQASILIHARKGHCCLNEHLFCVGAVEETKCCCGIDKKTVRHVLCICALGVAQQRTLRLSLAIDGVTYHTYSVNEESVQTQNWEKCYMKRETFRKLTSRSLKLRLITYKRQAGSYTSLEKDKLVERRTYTRCTRCETRQRISCV
jgi:hypothetical protein